MTDFEGKLALLRDEIDVIDSKLVDLLAQRLAVTSKVGQLKSQHGVPIYAPDREALLLTKRRKQAADNGVSPQLVEDVLRRMMRDSYLSQDSSGYQCVNPNCNKVVIIGGAGQLGSIFVDLFKRSNYQVTVLEQEDWPNSDSILNNASLVIVAVPICHTLTVIEKLTNLPDDCILADVTSVKSAALQAMLTVHQGPVVGLHPMFGPEVTSLLKQTIIACDGRYSEKYHWIFEQFRVWGAKIYPVQASEHDQAMSIVQVMRHFSTIAYGSHLMNENVDLAKLIDMSSPIYRLELMMVGRLFAQNPVLYTDIIFANKDNIAMMKRFAHNFLDLLTRVEQGDKQGFINEFSQVSQWFGYYADIFLKESQLLLQKANEV
jgi:chorismate mutase/prephenate dehydrogenase